LWDYPKVIKKMMDLGTVKRKLDAWKYKTAAECAEDIRLVWTNCMTYNADGSDFYLLAEAFMKRFEDRYRRIKMECKFFAPKNSSLISICSCYFLNNLMQSTLEMTMRKIQLAEKIAHHLWRLGPNLLQIFLD